MAERAAPFVNNVGESLYGINFYDFETIPFRSI